MSADSQRLKSALRRIVLESPELRELLGASDNRGDQPGSAGVGTSEAEESRLCCDGSTSDNANPGTSERDPDASAQTGLDPNDPADLTSGDGTLSGVTDCATGEPICFDGNGFIPPDGWDEPDEPPVDARYEEGYWWSNGPTASTGWASPEQAMNELYPEQGPYCYIYQTDPIRYGTRVSRDQPGSSFNECGFVAITLYRRTCGSSEDVWCTDVPRSSDTWPSDGCTNIAIVNGSIVGSKYDPENSAGDYSAPRDEIQLCSGADQIGLKPAANGGWKTINASTNSGYLWDSQGNKIAHIDGNEYSDPDV